VVRAQEEARRLDHDYVGTEHILLALTHESIGGLAANVLESLGIRPGDEDEEPMVRVTGEQGGPAGPTLAGA
jgi:ATP-dependent Clp protease ATP-binding subunit ClpA